MLYFSFLIAYTVQLFAPTSATIALTEPSAETTVSSSTASTPPAKPADKKTTDDKAKTEKEKLEKEKADKKATDDKTVTDKNDKEKTNKEAADKKASDEKSDKEKADKEATDKADKEKADKDAADKADKEKNDKEAADKANKEKIDKEANDKKAADDKAAAVPKVEVKAQQILISVYIQNNFTKDAKLKQIELLTSKKTEPFIKNNLNIPIPASKSLYSKGSITAFDLTADRNSVETFNGIQSITINDDKLTFNNVKTGSSLSNPIKITQKDGHWVLDK